MERLENINENFEVHYSDGIRGMKKFKSERDARTFMSDTIENKKGLQEIAIYKAGSGFHSTADTKAVISFWGEGSYLDNVSKKDSKLAAKKLEESLTERHITVKRKYTENYPAKTVGKAAKIRNKVLEAIKDGKLTKEEFDSVLREMTTDSTRWVRRNATYLNISEDGITLTKTGKRILNELTPVTSTSDVNEKASPFKIANANAEEIFGEFGIATLSFDQIERVIDIKKANKLSKRYGEDSFMALPEFEMEELLNKNPKLVLENKNKNMKTQFIYESFNLFIESLVDLDQLKESVVNEAKFKKGQYIKSKADSNDFDGDVYDKTNDIDGSEILKNSSFEIYEIGKDEVVLWSDADEVEYSIDPDDLKKHFVKESVVNEAFSSQRLAELFMGTNGKLDKNLAKAFYGSTKVAMDKVQDEDIISTDPQTAYKAKQSNTIIFYISDNEKENPHAPYDAYQSDKVIPGGGYLLAVTSGGNKFYDQVWSDRSRYTARKNNDRNLKMVDNNPSDSIGISKKYKGWDATGLYNVKRIAEVADRAIVINLDLLQQKYSTTNKRDARQAAKSGALAFKSSKDFKSENEARYKSILATKASKLPLDSMVSDAIDALTKQIQDGLKSGEKTQYGEILIGKNKKGNGVKLKDASNHMSSILDDYSRYCDYVKQEEESEKRFGSSESWYQREVKQYAKSIKDRINQIETFEYAW